MPRITDDEYRTRLERLQIEVAKAQLDLFLVTSIDSIYYLTGAGFEPLERPFFLAVHPSGQGAERQRLSDLVQDSWVAFARSGAPNHPGLPPWPAYGAEARATLILDANTYVQTDPLSRERTVWDEVPFDGVNPAIGCCVPTTREILASFLKLTENSGADVRPPGLGIAKRSQARTTRMSL
jgi:Xaa-Pro aminopeptidase